MPIMDRFVMTSPDGTNPSSLPSVEELLVELAAIAEVEAVNPDLPLDDLEGIGVDSLDLLEWLYGTADRYGLDVDETVFERLEEDATLRSVYASLVEAASL